MTRIEKADHSLHHFTPLEAGMAGWREPLSHIMNQGRVRTGSVRPRRTISTMSCCDVMFWRLHRPPADGVSQPPGHTAAAGRSLFKGRFLGGRGRKCPTSCSKSVPRAPSQLGPVRPEKKKKKRILREHSALAKAGVIWAEYLGHHRQKSVTGRLPTGQNIKAPGAVQQPRVRGLRR